ncbi:MAG: aldehyde dehydrogenase family protein [Pseudolabrys sp.]|nr:aldehyde dehydrogenase family protein [Pseudolabrys sp.]
MDNGSAKLLTSFVNGKSLESSEAVLDLASPANGSISARLSEAGERGVSDAVEGALKAFKAHVGSTAYQRSCWLRAVSKKILESCDGLADIVSKEVGKPIRVATIEARRAAAFVEACAFSLLEMGGEALPLDAMANGSGKFGFSRRIPYGVVGAVTPFNGPITLVLQKVVPAIAVGNAIVVKPAPAGTQVALALARLFVDAGLPKGLFNVVTGDRVTALALAAHPDVRVVSFTGGSAAGEVLGRAAGSKKYLAELGSNTANIVFADANLQCAATKIAFAAFEASGQQCISAQRVLVQRPILESFSKAFVSAAAALKVGSASDPSTDVGPMVHLAAADRVLAMCDDAVAKGARYLLKPKRDNCIVSPGILVGVPFDARLWSEEVFGPIAIIQPFDTVEEAIKLANDTPFGLQGSVFTESLTVALRCFNEFEVGGLWVNEASRFRLDNYPFGGVKGSGVGREGIKYAMEEYSQLKFMGISTPPSSEGPSILS